VLQKTALAEMDSDIVLNKPDLNMWQCRGMVCRPSDDQDCIIYDNYL